MQMRRERHHAYRFLTRRIVSAMLSGEPETNELPMRRFGMAVVGSVLIAALAFAGVAVYGLLVPGGGKPAENVIIVERETGARYLYLQQQLHPVLNWTSALLILGQPTPTVQTMSRSSLRDIPRGRPVGIEGAPDSLPDKGSLLGLPWSVCSAPRSTTSVALATHVLVGSVPAGGTPLGADEGVLVNSAGTNDRYLVWHDHRLRIPGNATVAALGWAGVRPAPVGLAFLNALPAGPDLAPIALPDEDQRANHFVDGVPTQVGQLFRASGHTYLMLREGLVPIGDVSVRLLVATGRPITETSAQEVGRVLVDGAIEPPGLPQTIPSIHGADDRFTMACAVYSGATEVDRPVTVESFTQVPPQLSLPGQPTALRDGVDGVPVADDVALPGGHGALAATLTPAGAAAPGNLYLITDQGLKYPIPRTAAAAVQAGLGYSGVTPVAVPGSVLALIPTGPALDPRAAALFAGPTPVDATPSTEAH
jgi:type VII secretion protein EccB